MSSESDDDFEFINNLNARMPRTFAPRPNFLEILDDFEFLRRFRMSKESFQFLLTKISNKILPTTAR